MTANDSDVSDGDTLTGSQVVRVYGENLAYPFVTLTFEGVEYSPITQGEGYIEFILTDNGAAIIAVDGSRFMSFEINGITVPSVMSGHISARLAETTSDMNGPYPLVSETGSLMYPYTIDTDYPFIKPTVTMAAGATDITRDITCVNCRIERHTFETVYYRFVIWISPVDSSKPCYMIYNGFIFFVANYTTD